MAKDGSQELSSSSSLNKNKLTNIMFPSQSLWLVYFQFLTLTAIIWLPKTLVMIIHLLIYTCKLKYLVKITLLKRRRELHYHAISAYVIWDCVINTTYIYIHSNWKCYFVKGNRFSNPLSGSSNSSLNAYSTKSYRNYESQNN